MYPFEMSTKSSSAPSMYSKVVDVISKAPDVRKDFEVHSILPWFRKKSQLFQKLKTGREIMQLF